ETEPAETTDDGIYTVTFVVLGNEYTVQVQKDETPVCPVTPPKTATDPNGINLKYMGWDKEITSVTEDTVYTAQYGSAATVMQAKNGAKAILTMTYDDGNYDSAVWVNQKNKTYGLKGSCMIIAGRSAFTDKVSQWKTLLADGTLDIQSHGWYHDHPHTDYGSHADHVKDVVESKKRLEGYFPGNDVLVYATPYTKITDYSYAVSGDENSQIIQDGGTRALIHENYFANRNGPSGLQSLDPTMGDGKGSWYNPYVQWLKTESSQNDEIRAGWIDEAVQQKGWLIILAHSVVDNPDSEWNISKTAAENFYRHAASYVRTGELWSATFGEAVKYIRERQNSSAAERYDKQNNVLYVDLAINRTAEDGKYLTESVFDYPLTVEVKVPANWKSARYTDENGKMQVASVYTRDGVSYAKVNMIPGADGKTVTTALYPLGTK
ncbi:MAG: hypothetical protein J5958_03265, partial [Clostridia bacterium]|nr:hypothetical protein [Clostridia bacterium]